MSDESDIELQDSIIHTRARRANAGNRMKNLLAASRPEDEEEDEMFKEVENDREFDLEAYKQVKREVGASDFSSDSEISEDDKDLDEGERILAKQQRQAKKEQRRKDREKMFKIKEHAPPRPAKKKKLERSTEDTIEILMADTRRASQRRSAIDNRQRTIERLRENERKRSEYVTPVHRKKVKLTQAQRLAEAKITEEKNTASLHNFVEMEEQRKYQQRMAMLGKRKRLTNFVRFVSRSIYEYPVPTEAPPVPYHGYSQPPPSSTGSTMSQGAQSTLPTSSGEPVSSGSAAPAVASSPAPYQYNPRGQLYAGLDDEENEKPHRNGQLGQVKAAKTGQLGQLGQLGGQLKQKTDDDKQKEQAQAVPNLEPVNSEDQDENASRDRESPEPAEQEQDTGSVEPEHNSSKTSPEPEPSKPLETIKSEPGEEIKGNSKEVEAATENADEPAAEETKFEPNNEDFSDDLGELEEIRETAGPPVIKAFNSITLEEFNTPVNNKLVARSIILGENNVKPPGIPPRRICPFTGEIAKYIDPQTGLAYLNIHIYRLIKRIRGHEYVWSSGAGGVYTQPWAGQRHAKGVPPGFADPKDLPEPSPEIKKEIEKRKVALQTRETPSPAATPADAIPKQEPTEEPTEEPAAEPAKAST